MKKKGIRAERELLHMFFDKGWRCIRSAGSGSMPLPSPDLLTGKNGKIYAIECKSSKGKHISLSKKEVAELLDFSRIFGAEALIGVRFNIIGWYFLNIRKLKHTAGDNYGVSLKLAEKKGLKFEDLTAKV